MPFSPAEPPVVVRLSSPPDIVDAVPYLVGFHPVSSLVMISLRGPTGRVGLTGRVDLPDPEWADECARQLVTYLRRDGARRAILVFYPRTRGPDDPAVRAMSTAMADRLGRAEISVPEQLCVADGRWWSLSCRSPACCPPEGTPVRAGAPSALATAMTVEGRVVLPSREALARTLEPATGAMATAMAFALPRAEAELAHRVWSGHRDEVERESLELLRAAVERRLDEGPACDDAEAARLIAGLADTPVRDEVIGWSDGAWGAAARSLLTELVGRSLPPFHVPPLTVLGWLAYQQGDGALASLAVERALADDPGYGLARLLQHAVNAGLDPSALRAAIHGPAGPGGDGRREPPDRPGAALRDAGSAPPARAPSVRRRARSPGGGARRSPPGERVLGEPGSGEATTTRLHDGPVDGGGC